MSTEYFGLDIANVREIIAAVAGVATFAFTIFKVGRSFGSKADKRAIAVLTNENTELQQRDNRHQERARELRIIANSSQDFWVRPPKPPFDVTHHRGQIAGSIPIISVVNFKGGVGKTTICANLAGYFARRGKRVLLVDFDYQGSLSDTLLTHARIEPFTSTSQKLITGYETPDQLRGSAERLTSLSSNLWLYPAFYAFSRSEIQIMFRWLIGEDPEIRYNLHQYLQSDPFQDDELTAFDIVLIDCPPRLLTGSVNALAASTHVLVPTILDGQSHQATLNTLGAIQQFRQTLNKNLKTLGVVPSLVASATGYNDRELHFIEELERQIPQFHEPVPVLKERPIARKEQLARAGGSEVVYFSASNDQGTQQVRSMFSNLAEYVEPQVNWKRKHSTVVDLLDERHENRRIASSA